jgi:5-methylcytosine-specific restriction endonuclease McrA
MTTTKRECAECGLPYFRWCGEWRPDEYCVRGHPPRAGKVRQCRPPTWLKEAVNRGYPCGTPTCPNSAVHRGYCERCWPEVARRRNEQDRAARGSSCGRGYGRAHRRWSKTIIGRDLICQDCGARLAEEADYIIPIVNGGSRYTMSNGQALCKSCHSRKTRINNTVNNAE